MCLGLEGLVPAVFWICKDGVNMYEYILVLVESIQDVYLVEEILYKSPYKVAVHLLYSDKTIASKLQERSGLIWISFK